jgi:ABC-2 type transport system ATP-binding protein
MQTITNTVSSLNQQIAISINGISKQYGDFTAVEAISLSISKNEIFGLLGPNGAGKTTTINMICGLLQPTSGKITFNSATGKDHKSLIGYCPQENIYYPKLTCMEQMMFIGQLYEIAGNQLKSKAVKLLEMLGLTDKANVLASKLSGGMKRRLNIGLALIHDPEILILDEPEAGLDPQSRILVREFIRKVSKEKTVILTTHNMDEADRLADRVAIIDRGKLLLIDTPQNLKRTIGDGDVLELVLANGNQTTIDLFVSDLTRSGMNVKISSNSVLIRHQYIVEKLAWIKSTAEELGLSLAELKIRENSLEDVFIHLTGRNLRQ